ncbi:MAG: lipoate--protein ligase [Bacteroidia bacterium]|nr:lipoate--protein ligase [Bacteroidia bacterium]
MLLIVTENTDVYFNLAAEDYLLHHFKDDVLMLWRSNSAVVCGKHQNICAEVNYGYCKTNDIQIARRLTGGGTVYHDLGNINFTFIQNIKEGLEKAINFKQFLDPVKAALLSMGIHAEYSDRNDLLLDGKKISGNAEHVLQKQKRVLHHGTLLFDADLTHLKEALHPKGLYTDKAVKSVRSVVTNIKNEHSNFSRTEFLENLYDYWLKQKHTNKYVFSENDLKSIETLQKEKYSALSWVVHYSPKYTLEKALIGPLGNWQIETEIKDGKVLGLNAISDEALAKEHLHTTDLTAFIDQTLTHELSRACSEMLAELQHTMDPYILF